MTQAQQVPTLEEQNATLTVGFEKALTMMHPEWRTTFTTEQVNQFRHFYHQGIQDIYLLVRIQNEQLAQNFQSVLHTVVVTGQEEEFARIQAEQSVSTEAAPSQAPVAKTRKKATKKAR